MNSKPRALLMVGCSFFLCSCEGNVKSLATSISPPDGVVTAEPEPKLPEPSTPPLEFDPLPRRIGIAKAKDKLTGLHTTDEELKQGATDEGLKALVDTWTKLPEFDAVMLPLFTDVFQQNLAHDDEPFQAGLNLSSQGSLAPQSSIPLARSLQEMFARTALQIVKENRPFTEVATTTRYMMNTPIMATYAFIDVAPRGDNGSRPKPDSWLRKKFPNYSFTVKDGLFAHTVPVEQTLDENSANFNVWTPNSREFKPDMDSDYGWGDEPIRIPYDQYAAGANFESLFGTLGNYFSGGKDGLPSLFTEADWNTWKWVNVRAPKTNENPTYFWNLKSLRTASEIVTPGPRVGYFTTPAYFTHWRATPGNSMRLQTNQALIIGLEISLVSREPLPASPTVTTAADHVKPGTACFSCHQTLDPMRDFIRRDYSAAGAAPRAMSSPVYGAPIGAQSVFKLSAIPLTGLGVADFGQAIASHPDFAKAWTQKICNWANTARCADSDPELLRIADAFQNSNFNFKVLLREFFASPISTSELRTKSSDESGQITSVVSREQLCHRMSSRGVKPDLCLLLPVSFIYNPIGNNPRFQASAAMPLTSYPRGVPAALVPRDPGILYQAAVDRACAYFANELVGNSPNFFNQHWPENGAASVQTALNEFVTVVMNVPASDERYTELRAALQRHYDQVLPLLEALPRNSPASQAMKSTFTIACSSPLAAGNGF
jgi:hypothetical protein